MSTSSNKDNSKEENENNSDSDFEMSISNAHSSDQTSNNNNSQDELQELQKKEKNKLADKLKKETDIYMNKQTNQSRTERLQFLINQTKTYANFLMSGKLEDKESKNRKLLSKKKKIL